MTAHCPPPPPSIPGYPPMTLPPCHTGHPGIGTGTAFTGTELVAPSVLLVLVLLVAAFSFGLRRAFR